MHALKVCTKRYGCFKFVCLFVSSISKKHVLFIICILSEQSHLFWVFIMLFWYFLDLECCSKYIMIF
jgi:hypothetical protein